MEHGEREGRPAVPGVVVAAGVVGALAVAALVLRPAEGLLHSGQGPLGHWGFVVIGLSIVWPVGVAHTAQRLRPRIGGDSRGLPAREERLRQAVVTLLLVGPGAIGVLSLVLHRFTRDSRASLPVDLPPPPSSPPSMPPARNIPPHEESPGDALSLPWYLLLGVLVALVVVVVTVVVVRRLRRVGLTVPPRPGPLDLPADDEDARLLLSAVRSARRALADAGDARAAVIACYAAMEDALAASGVRRHASDSPADLLTRAATAGLAPNPAAPRLTALFREARYSTHPMGAPHREAAAEALEDIAAHLQDRETAR
ncbi:DUF4129 domain-containing protein [Streptomyces sp. SID5910]|uniref:DUF4129 domain-containing protein n=1 Tax=Streptomyces sp. SID5910 TaxID=2690312 RepID=UPI00136CED30|nr:DUF4129 domain-containing protein [Streptomyces sp. SID5910]MYR43295.1 DUF4129 domain-containing protein [Streptomyces sp. SID5910]